MRFLIILSLLSFAVTACNTTRTQVTSKRKYAVVLIDDGKSQHEIVGYEYDSGKLGTNEIFIFTDLNDKIICKGKYTLQAQYTPGLISLNCFNGKIKGDGKFQIKGRRGNIAYGLATAETENENLRLVFGMTYDDFEKRRKALAILGK